jgi:large subunit ribosomal protein L22
MSLGYTTKTMKENMVRSQGVNLPISEKYAIEICNYIRKNPLHIAIKKLEDAISQKKAIPFKKYTNGVGHKPGNDIVAGRFAVKACTHILKIVKSAESNALFKGLNTKNLIISNILAKQAPENFHHGRQSRQKMKMCHIQVILEEVVAEKKEISKVKSEKKQISTSKNETENIKKNNDNKKDSENKSE